MVPSAFSAIFDRLMRAQEHLDLIKKDILAYYGGDLGHMFGEFDPGDETRAPDFVFQGFVTGPDVRVYTLVGEMVHDLRSALEHLAWQLVLANRHQPVEQESKFPVLKVRPTANKQAVHPFPDIAGRAGPNARALLDGAQPYQFGADYALHPLWQLDALWKIDKHRHVTVKGSRVDGFQIP